MERGILGINLDNRNAVNKSPSVIVEGGTQKQQLLCCYVVHGKMIGQYQLNSFQRSDITTKSNSSVWPIE